MKRHLALAAGIGGLIFVLAGCTHLITSELRPQSLTEDTATALVTLMGGNARLTAVYVPFAGGQARRLKLVDDDSKKADLGKRAFVPTTYGWATMADHSGRVALIRLPAGRVDLEIEHIQRRETQRQYKDGLVAKVWYRQFSWTQVITADLKADKEYRLHLPNAGCIRGMDLRRAEEAIIKRCQARLTDYWDKAVASAGPPMTQQEISPVEAASSSAIVDSAPAYNTAPTTPPTTYYRSHRSRTLFVPPAYTRTIKLPPRQKVPGSK